MTTSTFVLPLLIMLLLSCRNVSAFALTTLQPALGRERGLSISSSGLAASASSPTTTSLTLKEKLTAAGRGGLLSYGFLNCAYYVSVTMVTYVYYLRSGSELLCIPSSVSSLAERLAVSFAKMSKIAAIVWAGSQITKAFRIGTAIATAPLSEKLLDRFGSSNKQRSFALLCRGLLAFTFVFYFSLIVFTAVR